MDKVLHSSRAHDWRTPPEVFQAIEQLSSNPFTIDAAAQKGHELAPIGFGPGQARADALSPEPWGGAHDRVWLNPPYGRDLAKFVHRAFFEAANHGVNTMLLVPARTDTNWWQVAMAYADVIYFVKGRIKFLRADGTTSETAPFPSAVISIHRLGNTNDPEAIFGWRPW